MAGEFVVSEEWRPIPADWAWGYEVSSLGRIRSYRKPGRGGRSLYSEPRILVAGVNGEGYPIVKINQVTKTVHRLVALAFLGQCPDGLEICHGPDPDRSNNRVSNLRYDTRANNLGIDRLRDGTDFNGDKAPWAILTNEQVLALIQEYQPETKPRKKSLGLPTQAQLAEKYGVSEGAVWGYIHGRSFNRVTARRRS